MRRLIISLLTPCLLALLVSTQVYAQSEGLVLRLNRNFGYSSGTGRIQGSFSLSASGPADLTQVTFLIDGQPLGLASQPPFAIKFNTDQYSLGVHTIGAIGLTSGGQQLKSNEYRVEFVSAQAGWQAAGRIAIPIIGMVILIILLSYVVPTVAGRGKISNLPLGAQRNYGPMGGGICPKCGRPFALHLFGINLLAGKLERCPYCGRWSIVHRASLDNLHRAEAAELEAAKEGQAIPQASQEEELRKQIDDSRYQDS